MPSATAKTQSFTLDNLIYREQKNAASVAGTVIAFQKPRLTWR